MGIRLPFSVAASMLLCATGAVAQIESFNGDVDPGESVAVSVPVDPVVERGRYLALAGNCVSCHTAAGGRAMAGGLAFATPFGKIYSTNITSDVDTGIGGWTAEQFLQSMRKGVRPNGEHLYPVFPYTAFTKIKDDDISALYAYFKTVPAISYVPPQNEISFPFNQRSLMSVWKALFFDEGAYVPDATKSEDWNRGAYLVEALAHCSACHSPRNLLGAEKSGMAMTGGAYMDKVPSGAVREWSAPNLTSASNGLGGWTESDIVEYLKMGTNSFIESFGPMNEVIVNSTQHLEEADVRAMAVYLKSLPENEGSLGAPAKDTVLRQGETLYNVHCGTCHLPTGLGDPDEDSGSRLAGGSPVVQAGNPASLINVILYGPESPEPPLPAKRWNGMKAYGEILSDEEVAAVASYLRSAWGNKGGEVTVKQVQQQR